MKSHLFSAVSTGAVTIALVCLSSAPAYAQDSPTHVILERYPEALKAQAQLYRKQLEAAAPQGPHAVPYYLIVPTIRRWAPGTTLRVAFKGGDTALHDRIRAAAQAWSDAGANLRFSFKDAGGRYRTWSTGDTTLSAEIRIAFDTNSPWGAYWSMLGTDSITAAAGAAPNQPSLNLAGFAQQLPRNWKATAMHEFGHALGFEHEHKSPEGGCDFRFDDDPGYIQTKDADGWFIEDAQHRRPGLYTYLGGYANYWSSETVDFNLRAIKDTSAYLVGAFDKESIMKYFFEDLMFVKGKQSPCWTPSENLVLSSKDGEGVRTAYPSDAPAISSINSEVTQVLKQVEGSMAVPQSMRDLASKRLKGEVPL